ncbi:hypothetical protein DICPUDRAFT_83555 [Dictyostelium purpureum]|uniref:G domain-containing protein n=1 Tax=Dictyostelium purpureum TaxID=5786 RepID=F0ZZV6_DICPU|nr:uncharacterized protein DICPUDRAFT_83555 [Dictyostelium purpureum]EGC30524.1 hypothetical protein DICPUDRAFT_83555 [Dictyostelium purpureum]|eukprot:XP_003292947.1 hypothetical protein DICPUDRAFT_83555 [Dictyostelium purpureum]
MDRLNSVKVTNCSSDDENEIKIDVIVELVQDKTFQNLYKRLHKLSIVNKKYQYSFIISFMGMTGTGKTTFIEFILNVLTGQAHSPTTLRAQDIENQGIGESKTNSVCRYEIRYYYRNQWMFGITIVDTPGFADVGGLEKDDQHIKSILNNVGKLESLDSVSYVVNGALTRKTLETLNCVSTMVSFCDNYNQADSVRNILNKMLPGINQKPLLFMDNPWAQHLKNIYKINRPDEAIKNCRVLFGVDNSDELEKKKSEKIEIITQFFIHIFSSQKSFKPEGMKMLQEHKVELLSKLKELVENLSSVTNLYIELTDDKISSLIEKSKSISIEEWLKDRGATEALNKSKEYEEHVIGDIGLILNSLKRTYEQYHEIAIQAQNNEKADNIQKILDQLKLFIEALNATDEYNFDEKLITSEKTIFAWVPFSFD